MSVRVIRGDANDGGFMLAGNIHVTRKELEILMLIAMGMSNEEVAERLSISVNTVRNHGYNVVKKLGANNRANAVVKAVENNMIAIERYKSLVGWKPEEWVMCWKCQRAYPIDEAIELEQEPFVVDHIKYEPPPVLACPYEGCEARLDDTWFWNEIKEIHPEYPTIPERDVVYHVRW